MSKEWVIIKQQKEKVKKQTVLDKPLRICYLLEMIHPIVAGSGVRKRLFLPFLIIIAYLCLTYVAYPGLFTHFSTELPYSFLRTHMADLHSIVGIIVNSTHTPLNLIYHLPFFYPESYMLTRTHPLFGISLIFKIFFMAGLNLEQSYNLFIIFSLICGAWGCYLLAREFGSGTWLAFGFSSLYIIHNKNLLHFFWPNFLCHFYVPFIFFFLFRYFRSRKKIFAVLSGLLLFLQTLSSLYYGFQLWIFILPAFLLISLFFKITTFREFRFLVLVFLLVALILAVIFHPYLTIKHPEAKKNSEKNTLSAVDFFSSSKLLATWLPIPKRNFEFLHPGFIFMFALLFYFASQLKKRKWLCFGIMASTVVGLSIMAFINFRILDYPFLLFLIGIGFFLIVIRKTFDPREKVIIMTLALFILLFLSFPHIHLLRSFSFYNLIINPLPFTAFRGLNRVFIIIIPLAIVLAALGAERFLRRLKPQTGLIRAVIPILLLGLMVLENIHFYPLRHIRPEMLTKPLPSEENDIYRKIPFEKHEIILEIPFFFRFKYKNAIYMANWRYHRNALLNAKISYPPEKYYKKLLPILSPYQRKFPTENRIAELIKEYSVTYIIVHLESFKRYQHVFFANDNIRERIRNIKRYGKIVYEDNRCIIIRTQEFFPTDTLVRTYSYYHLKNRLIQVTLNRKYNGRVRIILNNSTAQSIQVDSFRFTVNLKKARIRLPGNRIKIRFEKSIELDKIKIID
jgi:hypothetical protein